MTLQFLLIFFFLQIESELDEQYLIVKGKNVTWYRPTNFKTLLLLKEQYPSAKIVIGNTEIGLYISFLLDRYSFAVSR